MASGSRGEEDSKVKEIIEDGQLKRELTLALDKLVLVDFFGTR